jgi:hypothetical protein
MGDNQDRWKDDLLKSSLPLEHLVAEKLERKNLLIAGEYPYIRPNGQNIETEFSADLHAYVLFRSSSESTNKSRLNFLVECKYNYPGVKWVFSPHARGQGEPLSIHTLEQRDNDVSIDSPRNLYLNLPICNHGICLHNSGSDLNAITHGLDQLRYAMPNLVLQEAGKMQGFRVNIRLERSFACLILVATADLYVLKPDQNLEAYRSTKTLDDVAAQVDTLIVAQERGPSLQKYCEWLIDPSSQDRRNRDYSDRITLDRHVDSFFPKVFQVVVVHFEALEKTIDMIKNSIVTVLF